MDRRSRLIEVFEDTQRFYTQNPVLAASVEASRKATKLYEANVYPELPVLGTIESLYAIADDPDASLSAQAAAMSDIRRLENGAVSDNVQHLGKVYVSKSKTLEAAIKYHHECPEKRIAVLNFASASRPGGGVKNGSSAQEESLCRCSTLYPTLDRRWLWEKFYDINRASKDVRHTDACIYSPNVTICKTDADFPERMEQKDWISVDVISCAAPNLRNEPANWHNPETGAPIKMNPKQLYDIHLRRARHILTVAATNRVDILDTAQDSMWLNLLYTAANTKLRISMHLMKNLLH